MKYRIPSSFFLLATCGLFGVASTAAKCGPDALEFSETIAMKVERVGAVPARSTEMFDYNMAPMDNMADGSNVIYFLDQKFGVIYSYNHDSGATTKIFDINEDTIPDGMTLDYKFDNSLSSYRVKAMTKGPSPGTVIVVYTSTTLPTGWAEADARMPAPNAFGQWVCGPTPDRLTSLPDIYRPGTLPICADTGGGQPVLVGNDVFVQYDVTDAVTGMLDFDNPEPFFVAESYLGPGHLGGGIVTVDDGRILYSMGDCTMYGIDGAYAPQLDNEPCGKILRIHGVDGKGKYQILAKGVRNTQQMRIYTRTDSDREFLAFTDIGGVTAEEVNTIPLNTILKEKKVENFGWGRNIGDGRAREGTFYIDRGNGLILGTEPKCIEKAPKGEAGYIQPWIQFGRTDTDFFYAISSMAVPTSNVSELKLLWSEFNTGKLMGTTKYQSVKRNKPVIGYKIKLYASDGTTYLENGFNDLVQEELGDVGVYRGDPRLFHYPDGQAGVFIERTGVFYKLEEISMPN